MGCYFWDPDGSHIYGMSFWRGQVVCNLEGTGMWGHV